MKKKLAAALGGGAVLMLVLSGCGDDGEEKTSGWAKKVCDSWQPQLKKIEDANAQIKRVAGESSKPEEVQQTDSAAFQTLADAYKAIGAGLSSAGEPPVKDSRPSMEAAVKDFTATSQGYADLKAKIDALDPKDQAKFAAGLQELADGLDKVAASEKTAKDKLKSANLSDPLAKQPGCQITTSSPAAG
ncbi:small secreted protein [Streptomyces sp. NPDC012888]|uniref:small secreted protein n=1 Tax=Streptomyces sp. NPDC012888 TaxID=3364855 RepID=UPI0036AE7E6B